MKHLDDMTLPRAVGQFGTDGHIAEFGIQHLFFRVRQAVLLFGSLVTRQDIQKDQAHDQSDQRVVFPDLLAAEYVSV